MTSQIATNTLCAAYITGVKYLYYGEKNYNLFDTISELSEKINELEEKLVSLNNLLNIDVKSIKDGDVLSWNKEKEKWEAVSFE